MPPSPTRDAFEGATKRGPLTTTCGIARAGLILFAIYVWRAPLDWVTDFVVDRIQNDIRNLQPPDTSTP